MRRAIALLAIFIVAAVSAGGTIVSGFEKAPPSMGMERRTAYTLRASELQIGALLVDGYDRIVRSDLHVDIGISDSLQVGMAVFSTLDGRAHGWVNASNQFSDEGSLGSWLNLRYHDRWNPRFYGTTGFCLGLAGEAQNGVYYLNAGLQIRFSLHLDGGGFSWFKFSPYGIAHVEVADWIIALAEIAYGPNFMRMGVLMGLGDFLDLRATVDPFDLSAQFGANIRIRFGGVE